jgi:hypothetical protein
MSTVWGTVGFLWHSRESREDMCASMLLVFLLVLTTSITYSASLSNVRRSIEARPGAKAPNLQSGHNLVS